MYKKYFVPFLWREFKLRNSRISVVDNPIKAIRIERRDGVLFIPLEEFLRTKRLLEGLSEEERKVLKKIKDAFLTYSLKYH